MSASEFRIPYQQVSSSQPAENVTQFKICRCGEGNTSENGDSPPTSCPSCQVLKSGHLLLSSKGYLYRFNVPPPRGAEPIVTLGGIDLNSSGSPSFLEKALRFIEDHGKIEFSPEEDAHVIGDCIKYVLREMPSSPVPASCCSALVKAYRTDKTRRLDEINRVIYEVFPEPNRQLLQRILKMMQIVGSHKAVNRMSQSALAACMAPLLLRPLLLGECEIDNEFSMGGDGSFQLLQAAAAANHAQAIVIIMMEEFDQIFDDLDEGSCSSEAYTESEDDDVHKEYSTDNDIHDDDGSYDSGEDDIEGLDDNSENYSDGSEHNSKINANVKDGKVTLFLFLLKTTFQKLQARKDLSTEEIEFSGDDETLIDKLEHNKIDLQSKIAKEVENLRDQLHKERNLRSSLESGVMNLRRGQGDVGQSRTHPPSTDKTGQEAVGSITRRAPQRMQSVAREGQDGSSSVSKWNLAQRQYSNSPLLREPGGSAVPAASFALAKLTNRLNFLKERRAQLASEMQSLDLGRPPAAVAAGGAPSVKSPTPKGPEKRRS
ncbi:hypothetical protein HU200_056548 [Digitaria exilis]|uniref:Rho-GAP domain-containing protein n=1 Tax=Digitaria exilis TaxID=1010633 RepID=A0A835ADN6_9POAL|nr:hypothetical protein HU200_056548 [Digitaria exilis]